jgi:muramoyltetrapeptide carboxypeptidase
MHEPLRPAALRPGDLVTLVSPSGPVRAEYVADGVALLESRGLRVSVGRHTYSRNGFLAGTDGERLADLNAALADPEVRAVVCTRGGYGAQRVVDGLDMPVVRADPKLVVGFSDITALQLALWRGARLATVHGPGPRRLAELAPACGESMRRAVMTDEPVVVARDPAEETASVLVAGAARGTLLGGNLCLIASTIGTPDMPDLSGALLLLEDLQEPPYKVDRMLTHLRRAGVLTGVAGIAVGQFTECADEWPVSVVDVLTDRLCDLGVPVLGGLPVGHGAGQLTVPLGVPATLDADAGKLIVEAGVKTVTAG